MKNKTKKGFVFLGLFIGIPQLWALAIVFAAFITVLPMSLYGLYFQSKISLDADYEDKTETLMGVDANGNGVRDDIEMYADQKFHEDDKILKEALLEWGRALNQVINTSESDLNFLSVKRYYQDTSSCFDLLYDVEEFNTLRTTDFTRMILQTFFLKNYDHYMTGKFIDLFKNTPKRRAFLDKKDFIWPDAFRDGYSAPLICKHLNLTKEQLFDISTTDNEVYKWEKKYKRFDYSHLYDNYLEVYKGIIPFETYRHELISRGEYYENLFKELDAAGYTPR